MKKILYIIDRANFYGSERHVYDILNYMKNNSKFEIEFLCFFKGELYSKLELEKKIKIYYFKLSWFEILFKIILLIKLILKIKPDILHCHQPKALFIGTLLGKILKIKTIITLHTDIELIKYSNNNLVKKKIIYNFHNLIDKFVKKYSDISIYLTNFNLIEKNKKNIVIYNWVSQNFNFIMTNKKEWEPNKKIKILCISSITPEKGYNDLIEFLSKCDQYLPIEVNIIGGGKQKYINKLLEEIKIKKIKFKINFWGYQREIGEFYENSDIFILFSKSETFGLVYVEAMYYGLPIFSYELPVLKEILPNINFIDNDLVNQALNLKKLISNKKLYKKISKINRMKVEKSFNYLTNIKKIEKIYLNIVNEGRNL